MRTAAAFVVMMLRGHERAPPAWPAGFVVVLSSCSSVCRGLVALGNAIQDAAKSARVPLCVVAAGLPQTPDLVRAAASFTERFDFHVLGRLDEVDAERALLEPSLAVGVRWEPAAAQEVLRAAGGSPYLIQYIGTRPGRTPTWP